MKKSAFCLIIACLIGTSLYAESDLLIHPSDIRLVPEDAAGFFSKSGYHLYIRKKPGIESVILTETTKDPDGKADNYAYRALEWNKVNGDEIRYLNGKPLTSAWAKYSLIDSTVEKDPEFGESFHIYIPSVIQYGYSWARHGTVNISKGTFINIRTFERKYGDYRGKFLDNPFMFDLGTPPPQPVIVARAVPEPEIKEVPVLTDNYNPVAAEKFQEISEMLTYSKGPETLVADIMKSVNSIEPKDKVDCVFAIDATGSMLDDVDQLRKEWVPRLLVDLKQFKHIRLGLLLYRDYVDSWRYKGIPVQFHDFTDNLDQFLKDLNSFVIRGNEGGDIPEAVYEAMYGALEFYNWDPEAVKRIILIGDAEPHPVPRGTGKYTKKLVMDLSEQKNIPITAIILPDDKSKRGR